MESMLCLQGLQATVGHWLHEHYLTDGMYGIMADIAPYCGLARMGWMLSRSISRLLSYMASYLTTKFSTWSNQKGLRNQGKRCGYGSWNEACMGWNRAEGSGTKWWTRQCYHGGSHDCHVNHAYITKRRRAELWLQQCMLIIFCLSQANCLRTNTSKLKWKAYGRFQALVRPSTVLGLASPGIIRSVLSTYLRLPWLTKS